MLRRRQPGYPSLKTLAKRAIGYSARQARRREASSNFSRLMQKKCSAILCTELSAEQMILSPH
ncbi:hypothetical protein MHPYR_310082 [uncultured Mycobacterium sp.]|uniref:Transposase n=1 Tax=uncultured Mycobacterium sp. TaxID=171292 RepID=A0A1Y5PKJ3_9MYCO|nr:hypothetical protein MHPYR_310082 [uncultured Mycobacterium sp.]